VIYEVVLIPGSEGTYIPGQYQGTYSNDYLNPGPRSIAVDAYNNIWGGCYGTKKFYYIEGYNGQILKTIDVSSVNHTPYGAVMDEMAYSGRLVMTKTTSSVLILQTTHTLPLIWII